MNKLDEILSETQCDLENTKSIFSESIMEKCIFDGLRWAGYLDEVTEVESPRNGVHVGEKISKRGADLVKSLLDGKVLHIVLAYFVSPEYYCRLALLLKNSYNYYYGDKRWSFKEVMCKHFFILEDGKFAGFRESIPGVKYLTTDEFLKGVAMRKFDLIIGNPPYNNGLDLKIHKILENNVTPDGKIVFVHPSGFLLSHRDNAKKDGVKSIDLSKMESAHLFWANDIFNIGLFVPACISVWSKDKTTDNVHVIDDAFTKTTYDVKYDKIHIYGKDYEKFTRWLATNVDYSDNIPAHGEKIATRKYAFVFSVVRGHPNNEDFFTILPKEDVVITNNCVECGYDITTDSNKFLFSFKTASERINFIKFLKTKSVRFILSLIKVHQNISGDLKNIPWMDFTRSYSDKDLCKKWNIDEKLWKFIDSHIPNYYPDYHFDGFYEDDTSKKLKNKVDELVDDAEQVGGEECAEKEEMP